MCVPGWGRCAIRKGLRYLGGKDDFFSEKKSLQAQEGGTESEQGGGGREAGGGGAESAASESVAGWLHTGCCSSASPLLLPRLLLGQGQLGRTRPRGHNCHTTTNILGKMQTQKCISVLLKYSILFLD